MTSNTSRFLAAAIVDCEDVESSEVPVLLGNADPCGLNKVPSLD